MRIVFFGSPGPQSFLPLQELLRENDVVAAVLPFERRDLRRRLSSILQRVRRIAPPPTAGLLSTRSIPTLRPKRSELDALASRLAELAPDIICIAAYPYLLPASVLSCARRAVLNFHPSLLPRHRGPLPLFWIYHADDRQSGATIHLVDAGADTGAIVAQSSFDLPRGLSVLELADRTRHLGAALLREAVSDLDRSLGQARPQDHTAATTAPLVRPGAAMVDFAQWGAERVWHFLHGLHPFFLEPLAGPRGEPLAYSGVEDYQPGHSSAIPGSVTVTESHLLLHCHDGVVRLRR